MAFIRCAALSLLVLLLAVPAGASDAVSIHGFGTWAYGATDNGNHYLNGSDGGDYDHAQFSLSVTAEPVPSIWIHAQPFWDTGHEGTEAVVDYAFAEWAPGDLLRLRAGRVKQPFGVYTEIFDVGTLRPFLTLPQSIYGPVGIVAESYQGAGLSGSRVFGGWRLHYDAYFGAVNLASSSVGVEFDGHDDAGEPEAVDAEVEEAAVAAGGEEALEKAKDGGEDEEGVQVKDAFGGRLTLDAPLPGLSFGFSGFSGEGDSDAGEGDHRHTALGAHVQYQAGGTNVVAEYAWLDHDQVKVDAGYAELGQRFLGRFEAVLRYDRLRTDVDGGFAAAHSLQDHEEWAVGINYWFSPNFVLKVSHHWVDGNRFARPLEEAGLDEAVEGGGLEKSTRLIMAGLNFSF